MKRFLIGLLMFTILSVGGCLWLARGPDFPVYFERVVETHEPPARIQRSLERYRSWPQWHHFTSDVSIVGKPTTELPQVGDELVLTLVPRGHAWRQYTISTQVEEWDPARKIRLRLVKDGKGKVSAMFSDLSWSISIEPAELGGTRVRGELRAQTASGRARFFSRISERILLNQVFYPDLQKMIGERSSIGVDLSPR